MTLSPPTNIQKVTFGTSAAEVETLPIQARTSTPLITIGVIGLGFTGLPLATAFATAGHRVIGFDIDLERIAALRASQRVRWPATSRSEELIHSERFIFTSEPDSLAPADAVVISVPTPLRDGLPDLEAVTAASRTVASVLRPGMLVVLESTTFPGTSRELVLPILETSGFRCGEDFFLAYSPERLCPGLDVDMLDTPRLVGGFCAKSVAAAEALYRTVFHSVVPVRSMEIAESAKLLENIFRLVNISLVNELKEYFDAAGIPAWEVVNAAASKPYGFMPFRPGLGAGGHCIPVDPRYLIWSASRLGVATPLVQQACSINDSIPARVIDKFELAFKRVVRRPLNGSTVVIVGAAYKADIADIRESPAVNIMRQLFARGVTILIYDEIINTRQRQHLTRIVGARFVAPTDPDFPLADAILICTAHTVIDISSVLGAGPPVFDPVGISTAEHDTGNYYAI